MPISKVLREEDFEEMYALLMTARIDRFIRPAKKKQKGDILPFVRGLRFSALLIYAIREILSDSDLQVDWGHIVDEDTDTCSCECDIIIHHKGHIKRWNGNIMDFKFIAPEKVVAVISCKSYMRGVSDIDKEYCKSLKPFINKVWLYAECCPPDISERISKRALGFGYKKFWYLYEWHKDKDPQKNKIGWHKFIKEIQKLGNTSKSNKHKKRR